MGIQYRCASLQPSQKQSPSSLTVNPICQGRILFKQNTCFHIIVRGLHDFLSGSLKASREQHKQEYTQ